MAKIKLQLIANPTFKANVPIPIPGGNPVNVQFTFKHRNKDELQEFFDALKDNKEDIELIMAMASGWELDEPFDKDNIEMMITQYVGSAVAILETYISHATGSVHRAKN